MAQPREAITDDFEDIDGPVAILNVGSVDEDEHQKAAGVSNDMPFAALDLLARVITANSATFSGFDRLAVDDTATGRGLAALISRRFMTSTMLIASNKPVSRQV